MIEVDLGQIKHHKIPTPIEVWDETPVVETNEIGGARRTGVSISTEISPGNNFSRAGKYRADRLSVIGVTTELGYLTPNAAAILKEYSNITGTHLEGKEAGDLFKEVIQESGLYSTVDYLLKERGHNFDTVKKEIEGLGALNEFRNPLLAYLYLVKSYTPNLPLADQLTQAADNLAPDAIGKGKVARKIIGITKAILKGKLAKKAVGVADTAIKTADRLNVQKALRSRSNMVGYDVISLLRKGMSLSEALDMSGKTSKVAIAIENEIDNGLAKSTVVGDKERLNLLEKVLTTANKILPVVERWRSARDFINGRKIFEDLKDFSEAIFDVTYDRFGSDLNEFLKIIADLGNKRFNGINGYIELFKEMAPYERLLLSTDDDKNSLKFSILEAGNPQPREIEVNVNDFTLLVVGDMQGYIKFNSEESLRLVEKIQELSKILGETYLTTKDQLETYASIDLGTIQALEHISEDLGFETVYRGCSKIGKITVTPRFSLRGNNYTEFANEVNEYNRTIDPLNTASNELSKALHIEAPKTNVRGYLGAAVLSSLPSGAALVEPIADPRLIEFTNRNFTLGELFTRRAAVKALGLWKAIENTRLSININELRQPELTPGAVVSIATSVLLLLTYGSANRLVETRNATRTACLSVLPSQGLGYLTQDSNLVGNDALQVRSDFNAYLNPFVEDMATGEFKTNNLKFVDVLNVFGAPNIRKKTYSLPADMEKATFRGLVATALQSQIQKGIEGDSLTPESKKNIERMYRSLFSDSSKALEMWTSFYTVDGEIAPGLSSDGVDGNGKFDKDKRTQERLSRIQTRVDEMKVHLEKGIDFEKAISEAKDSLVQDCR